MSLLVPALAVIVGLIVYGMLVLPAPRGGPLRLLAGGVLLALLAGLFVLRIVPLDAGTQPGRALVALALLYFGWVGLTALVVQILRRRAPDLPVWAPALGAVSTLVPVAGLFLAEAMA